MKIVIDARMYGTEYTGVGRYIKNLIENLQKQDRKNRYIILLRKKYFETLRLNSNFEKMLVNFDHYSFSEQFKLPFLLNKLNADFVHFPHFNVPLLYRGKFIVTIHDSIMNKQRGKNASTRSRYLLTIKRLGYSFVFNHAVRASKKIIVPTMYVKKDLLSQYKIDSSRISVIYEALDNTVAPINSLRTNYHKNFHKLFEHKYFIYVGNAYPHKNINRLIEAIKYLNEDVKEEVKLVLVTGKNEFKNRLISFSKSIGAYKHLEFTRYVTDDELGFLYSKSAGFVYPSLEEGFGLQGLEAIANKTILLASEIPVFREVYGKSALYFNPYDFSSIQKAMFDVTTMTQQKREDQITSSQKVLEKYSLAKMAEKTMMLYGTLA